MEEGAQLVSDMGSELVDEIKYIGGLICYTIMHLDLSYYVTCMSRFISIPWRMHIVVAEWILKYIKGTTNYGMMFM
jgi:hypothetical protein